MFGTVRPLIISLAIFAAPAQAGGTLVIVGGGLEPDNAPVHQAFVDALPGEGEIVIISAASASPVESAASFSADLERYGVDRGRITQYPLAVRDDESTPDFDESTWRDNAWNEARVAALGRPAGFWFTGGDQIRIMETLTRDQSQASPLFALIRERLAVGAVVGGTSAGAAMMSRHMIAGGYSPVALLEPVVRDYASSDKVEEGRLLLTAGAGFLPNGIVDQHFLSRPRMGRLVRALHETGECVGYGIAEDTAMVVDLDAMQATVLGRGIVTLVDASAAVFDFDESLPVEGIAVSYAAAGEKFSLQPCPPGPDIGFHARGIHPPHQLSMTKESNSKRAP